MYMFIDNVFNCCFNQARIFWGVGGAQKFLAPFQRCLAPPQKVSAPPPPPNCIEINYYIYYLNATVSILMKKRTYERILICMQMFFKSLIIVFFRPTSDRSMVVSQTDRFQSGISRFTLGPCREQSTWRGLFLTTVYRRTIM